MTRPDDSTQSKRDIDLRDRRTGYNGIGYHWLIQRDGTVEKGRDELSASVHDDGISLAKSAVSICLIGGLDAAGEPSNNFTDDQVDAFVLLVREIRSRHSLTSTRSATPALTVDTINHWLWSPKE
jgi:hypothetical protein